MIRQNETKSRKQCFTFPSINIEINLKKSILNCRFTGTLRCLLPPTCSCAVEIVLLERDPNDRAITKETILRILTKKIYICIIHKSILINNKTMFHGLCSGLWHGMMKVPYSGPERISV